jgi:PAS domain S-box-containing protein
MGMITEAELDELFSALEFANPHTLFVGNDYAILRIGKAFQKSIAFTANLDFESIFHWVAGGSFEKLRNNSAQLFFIQTQDEKKRYKISGRTVEWGYILHGSPVINANFHISEYQLTLKDFPQQDYIAEYLFLLQTSSKALEDLQKLNHEYRLKNKALEESKQALVATSLFPEENPNPVLRIGEKYELLYSNPSATEFLKDFNFSAAHLDDDELKSNLEYVATNQMENFSIYLKRNNNTYLLNIRKKASNNFFNLYAANITHFVDQVSQKENELTALAIRLKDQQEFYEYILNNIPSDIAVFDEQHKYLFVNPQGIKSSETREFMIGKDDYDYCALKGTSTAGADFRRAKFLEVLKQDKEVEWEDDMHDANGNRKVIMRRMRPIYNPNSKKRNVVGYGIDITQRKLAEEEVTQSHLRLTLLEQFLNAASDAVQVADDHGNFVYINKSASERLGIPMEEITNYKVSDIDHQFKDPKEWQAHLEFLKEKGSFSSESVNVNQVTGKTIDVEVYVRHQVIDGNGYIIAASRDISERKQAERILAYKNEFQAVIMEVATEFIDINPDALDELINSTLERLGKFMKVDRVYLFEYNHEKQTTSNTHEWVAEDINPEISNLQEIPFEYVPVWVETHSKGENVEVENTTKLPDGMFKELLLEQDIKSLIALPLMHDGVSIGFVGLDAVKDYRKFYDDEKVLLVLLSRMLVNVKERIRNIKAIHESNLTINQINAELQKIIQAEKTVNVLADSFLTGTEYEEICWDIVENVISQLDFEDCVIYKLEEKSLVQVAAMGNKTKRRRVLKDTMKIPLGHGIVGAVAKTGKALLVEDTSIDERYIVDDEKRLSEVAVPIKLGRKIWGVIDSENERKGFFTDLHLRVLMTISNLLSQKISAIEEQKTKEKLQLEILEINAGLERRVAEETNRNLELTKSMSDQEKLVTIGEIASGIAHDLNTPLGAIKIGAESIRFTLDNLFGNVVSKCSEAQVNIALNRSIERQGELFVGGLQQRKEMKALDLFLADKYPDIALDARAKFVAMLVKTRVLPDQEEFIEQVLHSTNPFEFLELIYSLQIVRNFIETILTSSDRATNVVQDLRSFIKDQRNSDKGPVNLFDNINTVLNVFNYDIKRSVELIFDVDRNLFIEGFDIKLFQLWSNIIKNAIESLDQYKERGIIKIFTESTSEEVTVHIANNGPKISEEVKQHMFEKFYTTKARRNGSGLGLSIVKSVLDEHVAQMNLDSTEEWTTFSFTFKRLNYESEQKNEVEIELM